MYQVPFYVQRYSSNKTDSTLLQSPGDSIQLGPADHSLRFKIHFPPFKGIHPLLILEKHFSKKRFSEVQRKSL